jgi:glutathionyl-hydroquinone reductase
MNYYQHYFDSMLLIAVSLRGTRNYSHLSTYLKHFYQNQKAEITADLDIYRLDYHLKTLVRRLNGLLPVSLEGVLA